MSVNEVETKVLSAILVVDGFPKVLHPVIGEELSSGIVTEVNQKDYHRPYERNDCECVFLDLDYVRCDGVYTDKDGLTKVMITKDFTGDDAEIKKFMDKLSSFLIYDIVSDEVYDANLIGISETELHTL